MIRAFSRHLRRLFGPVEATEPFNGPRFVLLRSENGEHHWHLQAANGEIVAQSEQYGSRSGALNGILAVQDIAARARVVYRL